MLRYTDHSQGWPGRNYRICDQVQRSAYRSRCHRPEKFVLMDFPIRKTTTASYFFSACALKNDAPRSEGTRLNSSHVKSSYAVFCLKKKINTIPTRSIPPAGRNARS